MAQYSEASKKRDNKNNKRRRGIPTFSAVRFNDSCHSTGGEKKAFVEDVIEQHGGTREVALLDAFSCLEQKLINSDK